eukprot:TRINITY_DN7655_c0_g1_i1.p1 TRINITY_DN7655_c0_g1~~TRINITY_DN7655_c0_g1_i1.p1  ORF type:complete len:258 (+),score=38.43 TRINITY_DN7655_c0_g1_i1:218-991(+)
MILQRFQRSKTFGELITNEKFPENFEGSIAIFSDPAGLSPSFGSYMDILESSHAWGVFGIHPHNAKYYNDQIEGRIMECLALPKAVALGECGLDYHYKHSSREAQAVAFQRQMRLAVALSKPLVVHSRDAEKDTLDMLREHMPAQHQIHMHCHGGSESFTRDLMDHFPNLFFGFTGALTYSDSRADETRRLVSDVIPAERLLLETDGPYMPPNGVHGKVSHSGHIMYVAQEMARLRKVSVDELLAQVRANTMRMYGI